MPNIYTLSLLHSQQIAILGYIQVDGRTLYVKEIRRQSGKPSLGYPDPFSSPVELAAQNEAKTILYILTTSQDEARRMG